MDPFELAHTLAQSLLAHGGVGLAAPQIGIPYRACVIIGEPMLCMFNPMLVYTNPRERLENESCLSFPGVLVPVSRPADIRVRFTLPNGEVQTEKYSGITARIVQHEIDHLNGITLKEHVSALKWDMAVRKARKNGARI